MSLLVSVIPDGSRLGLIWPEEVFRPPKESHIDISVLDASLRKSKLAMGIDRPE